MAKKEKIETQIEESKEAPFMQTPTIRDAVTYIVDEQGNEVKADLITQIKKPDSTD